MSDLLVATEVNAFNKLFYELAKQKNYVLWIRSLDFKRQLYLSPQFEEVFERQVDTLYDTPEAW